jgi:predicted dienelactone hydrolase
MKHRSGRFVRLTFYLTCFLLLTFSITYAQEQPQPEPLGLRPDAPPYALHGPYWVGAREFDAQTDSHTSTITVWYPAQNPDGIPEQVTYHEYAAIAYRTIDWEGQALPNALPDASGGPYPLLIFAHGMNLGRFTSAYLTEHLTSYGFVVMAIDYADSLRTAYSVDPTLSLYTRPQDISWQIDYAETLNAAEGVLAGMIDTGRTAVIGHSLGGYSALMAAGGQLDLTGPTSWCVQYPDLSFPSEIGLRFREDFCEHARRLAAAASLENPPDDLWPAWGDSRVDAIVPLAPIPFIGANSVAKISVPVMLMVGSQDHVAFADAPLYKPYLYDHLGSAQKSLVVLQQADHSIFTSWCIDARWLVRVGASWMCSDPVWSMGQAHDLINHFTTAFLLDVLKGDTAAHAALAPEAVSFPGIIYEAQGY